ncbi:MAG: AmmeMemoRadiSam system protein A [Syntrophomonadaceae bacterium]|nr:AmmeMemoRadiSam system protein A [Syntrophomonadaceae bacterium]
MISYGALMPHPPVLIKEIGGTRLHQLQTSLETLSAISSELLAAKPDCIVFLTPHGNVFQDCLSYLTATYLEGDLRDFGWSDSRTSLNNDLRLMQTIAEQATVKNLPLLAVTPDLAQRYRLKENLDHGILVPLYFLQQAGMEEIPILAISVGLLTNEELYKFGKTIQEASDQLGRRVAVLASGDMSHALKEEGPYRFHPDGPRFDQTVKEACERGDWVSLLDIPPQLRGNARECGYPSLLILIGALDGYQPDKIITNYEGPFGVGYLSMGIKPGQKTESLIPGLENRKAKLTAARRTQEGPLVRWARLNLEHAVTGLKAPELDTELQELKTQRSAAFVSIKKGGSLRGCIGTILPAYKNLAEEIAHNALAAGLQDPRFTPVNAAELADLEYSVDVLGEPERCGHEDLDPRRFGVIVSYKGRRGLLLPDLEGVDSVEEQLHIACQKAGISPHEPYVIERFEVIRHK